MDAASYFYQWAVHPDDWHKLAVNSHRGQEFFTVATMGFRNSPPYVQRQTDRIFRRCPRTRGYIDDIVVHSKGLVQHVQDLRQCLQTLRDNNITMGPKKSFIGYPNVRLLGQHVDGFGLSTLNERTQAITNLQTPSTLSQLEHFLGATGYIRHLIPFYAQVAGPL